MPRNPKPVHFYEVDSSDQILLCSQIMEQEIISTSESVTRHAGDVYEFMTDILLLPRKLWSWVVLLVSTFFKLIRLLVPASVTNLFAKNYLITLTIQQLIVALFVLAALFFLFLRYRYFTGYSKVTQTVPDTVPTGTQGPRSHPSTMDLVKKGTGSYLDEFLLAIKAFGYLDRSVFRELTKNMTTQRVGVDEIIKLDETKGFLVVVEGTLKVYVKIYTKLQKSSEKEAPAGLKDSQEADTMREFGDKISDSLASSTKLMASSPPVVFDAKNELLDIEDDEESDENEEEFGSSEEILKIGRDRYQLLNEVKSGSPLTSLLSILDLFRKRAEVPNISLIAKASSGKDQGATIALIPKLAFERVYSNHPKATSHIVAMIMTRLFKVTMATTHNYLGLTRDIIELEMKLNQQNVPHLPSYLKDGLLEKFQISKKSSGMDPKKDDMDDYFGSKKHPSRINLNHTSLSRYVVLDSRSKSSHPGDILLSVPLLRKMAPFNSDQGESKKSEVKTRTFTAGMEETVDHSLRVAVVENLFKFLGIHDESGLSLSSMNSQASSSSALNLLSESENENHLGFQYDTIAFGSRRGSLKPPTLNRFDSSTKRSKSRELIDFDAVKQDFIGCVKLEKYEPDVTIILGATGLGLLYVIEGSLEVWDPLTDTKLYTVKEGGLGGYLSAILGFKSFVRVKAGKMGATVAQVSRKNLSLLTDKYYFCLLQIALKLKLLLSRKFLIIDYALEWCHIKAGEVLSSQGDPANGCHIILSGRFRGVESHDNQVNVLGEYGHGQLIGVLEVLTASPRTNTLIAVRDSETARIPRSLFEMLCLDNPLIMIKVSRLVANRVLATSNIPPLNIPNSLSEFDSSDYKTISIIPTTEGIPTREFANKLVNALKATGRKVILLDQALTLTHLGIYAFEEGLSRLKLLGYFAFLEEEYETVVYVCDSTLKSDWTATCMSQGDCILLLADADDKETASNIGNYEKLLLKQKTTARTELCLIHQESVVEPRLTSVWLRNRKWVDEHHHIQMEIKKDVKAEVSRARILIKKWTERLGNKDLKTRLEDIKQKALWLLSGGDKGDRSIQADVKRNVLPSYTSVQPHKNDFMRLARLLSNEAVGLVLGGGGSRGISHVGVVVALEKHGIPVDIIGGTSIGLFVGGLYAKEYNIMSIIGRSKRFALRVGSIWRQVFDLTYPVTSYLTGYEFNRGIWKIFGFSEIEDFWIKFFCNSTNITNLTMDIHETGFAWRFIRALMSLAGLLPPISYDGCMLLDGGYLDNLPVAEMKKRGIKHIFAVDVGLEDDRTPQNYGDTLLGFWVLFNRWNPFSQHPNVPNMMDIQVRLAYVASVNALEVAKKTPGVVYLRPPIDNYATLDFAKFDEIFHVGLDYADRLLTEWTKDGKIPKIAGIVDRGKAKRRKPTHRRHSF